MPIQIFSYRRSTSCNVSSFAASRLQTCLSCLYFKLSKDLMNRILLLIGYPYIQLMGQRPLVWVNQSRSVMPLSFQISWSNHVQLQHSLFWPLTHVTCFWPVQTSESCPHAHWHVSCPSPGDYISVAYDYSMNSCTGVSLAFMRALGSICLVVDNSLLNIVNTFILAPTKVRSHWIKITSFIVSHTCWLENKV